MNDSVWCRDICSIKRRDVGFHDSAWNKRKRFINKKLNERNLWMKLTMTPVDSDSNLKILIGDQGRNKLSILQVWRVKWSGCHVIHKEFCIRRVTVIKLSVVVISFEESIMTMLLNFVNERIKIEPLIKKTIKESFKDLFFICLLFLESFYFHSLFLLWWWF